MITSYNRFFSGSRYCSAYTVRHNVIHLAVHLLMIKPFFFCCVYNGVRYRMREVFFKAGGNSKQFVLASFCKRNNSHYLRLRFGKSTRFIKNDCIRLRHGFKIFASLYRNAAKPRFLDCGKHRYGGCKFYRT